MSENLIIEIQDETIIVVEEPQTEVIEIQEKPVGPDGSIPYCYDSGYKFVSGNIDQILTSKGINPPEFRNIADFLTAGQNIQITGTTNATISTVLNPVLDYIVLNRKDSGQSAETDKVKLYAIDYATDDTRLFVQPEQGSPFIFGNNEFIFGENIRLTKLAANQLGINSSVDIDGHLAVGNSSSLYTTRIIDIEEASTIFGNFTEWYGIHQAYTIDFSNHYNYSGLDARSLIFTINSAPSFQLNAVAIAGDHTTLNVYKEPVANCDIYGSFISVTATKGGWTDVVGDTQYLIARENFGSTTYLAAYRAWLDIVAEEGYSQSIENIYGLLVQSTFGETGTGSLTIPNYKGVYLKRPTLVGNPSISSAMGLHIEDNSGIGSVISYNIYSAGLTSLNVFEGIVDPKEIDFYNIRGDNYERAYMKWDADIFKIGTEKGGDGILRGVRLDPYIGINKNPSSGALLSMYWLGVGACTGISTEVYPNQAIQSGVNYANYVYISGRGSLGGYKYYGNIYTPEMEDGTYSLSFGGDYGVEVKAGGYSTLTVDEMFGVSVSLGIYAEQMGAEPYYWGATHVGDVYGIRVKDVVVTNDHVHVSNYYGVYIGNSEPPGDEISEYYNIYSAGVGTRNRFIGNIEFGNSATVVAALADTIRLYGKDYAANDARLYVQSEAGYPIIIGNNSIIINESSGPTLVITTKEKNILIGVGAGVSLTTAPESILIGYNAGNKMSISSGDCVVIGNQAMENNVYGCTNVVIGRNTLRVSTNVDGTVAIGSYAMEYHKGLYNVAIGENALKADTLDISYTYNVAIGRDCMRRFEGGSSVGIGAGAAYGWKGPGNVIIGYLAGGNAVPSTADGHNIFIGYYAGYYETGASSLFIDSIERSDEADARLKALIYGNFAAAVTDQLLRVNAVFDPYQIVMYNIRGDDYERSYFKWDSDIFKIGTEKGGSGNNRDIEISPNSWLNLNPGTYVAVQKEMHFAVDTSIEIYRVGFYGDYTQEAGIISWRGGESFTIRTISTGDGLPRDIVLMTELEYGEEAGIYLSATRVAVDNIFEILPGGAKTFYMHNVGGSDYERAYLKWDSDIFKIGTEKGGKAALRPMIVDTYYIDLVMGGMMVGKIDNTAWRIDTLVEIYSDTNPISFGLVTEDDPQLFKDSARALGLRSLVTTNPVAFNIYNTKSGINYERVFFKWDANIFKIGTEKGEDGILRAIEIGTTPQLVIIHNAEFQGVNPALYVDIVNGTDFNAYGADFRLYSGNGTIRFRTGGVGGLDPALSIVGSILESAVGLQQHFYNVVGDDYERAYLKWDTNIFKIGTEKGGDGIQRSLQLMDRISIDKDGNLNANTGLVQTWSFTNGNIYSGGARFVLGTIHPVKIDATDFAGETCCLDISNNFYTASGLKRGAYFHTLWNPISDTFDFYQLAIEPTVNQTGTASGNYVGFFMNITETAVLGIDNRLIDLQVNGSSKFKIDSVGIVTLNEGRLFNVGGENYERAYLKWDTNIFKIGTEKGGDGTVRDINIAAGNQIGMYAASGLILTTADQTRGFAVDAESGIHNWGFDFNNLYDPFFETSPHYKFMHLFNMSNGYQTNYERAYLKWDSDIFKIGTEAGGSGVDRGFQLIGPNAVIDTTPGVYGIKISGYGNQGFFFSDNYGILADTWVFGHSARSGTLAGALYPNADGVYWLGWSNDDTVHREIAKVFTKELLSYNISGVNYERGYLKWDANIFKIGTEKGGDGVARALNIAAAYIDIIPGAATYRIGDTGLYPLATNSVDLGYGLAFYDWRNVYVGTSVQLAVGGYEYFYNITGDDYERAYLKWDANIFKIGTEKGGDGVARALQILSASGITLQATASVLVAAGAGYQNLQLQSSYQNLYFSGEAGHKFSSVQQLGFNLVSIANDSAYRLVGSSTELSWLYVAPRINQSDTAAYNGIYVNVVEEAALGSGAAGDGNNLIRLAIAGATKVRIDRLGTYYAYNVIGDNYERAFLKWDSNIFKIGTEKGGTGLARSIEIGNSDAASTQDIWLYTAWSSGIVYLHSGQIRMIMHGVATQLWFGGGVYALYPSPNNADFDIGKSDAHFRSFYQRGAIYNYNIYTDADNWERSYLKWDTNVFKIGTEKGGDGVVRPVQIDDNGGDVTIVGSLGTISFSGGYQVDIQRVGGSYIRNTVNGPLNFLANNTMSWGKLDTTYCLTVDPMTPEIFTYPGTPIKMYNVIGTDYERAYLKWDANTFKIGTEAGGSGVKRPIEIVADVNVDGELIGFVPVLSYAADQLLTDGQVKGQLILVTATATITLPAVRIGATVTIFSTTAAAVMVDPNINDRVILDGVAGGDGKKITSDGSAGALVTLIGDSVDGWTVVGRAKTWTMES